MRARSAASSVRGPPSSAIRSEIRRAAGQRSAFSSRASARSPARSAHSQSSGGLMSVDRAGDYPGVAAKSDVYFYRDNCPDPNVLLNF